MVEQASCSILRPWLGTPVKNKFQKACKDGGAIVHLAWHPSTDFPIGCRGMITTHAWSEQGIQSAATLCSCQIRARWIVGLYKILRIHRAYVRSKQGQGV